MNHAERERIYRQWLADHGGLFVRLAQGFAPAAERDDLVQDMLLNAWNAVPAFRGDASPATFLYRVAQNTAMTWLRARYRRPVTEELTEDLHPAAPESLKVERTEAMYAAVRRLPELDRTLVLLYLDELPYSDIANITGLSESNVGARLNRARARLARLVEDHA